MSAVLASRMIATRPLWDATRFPRGSIFRLEARLVTRWQQQVARGDATTAERTAEALDLVRDYIARQR